MIRDDIQVTPEMIEAGEKVYSFGDYSDEHINYFLTNIYRAMAAADPRYGCWVDRGDDDILIIGIAHD